MPKCDFNKVEWLLLTYSGKIFWSLPPFYVNRETRKPSLKPSKEQN